MLKRYKRLLYILGVVVIFNLLHSNALSQVSAPTKIVEVCKEVAMPINLFNALGLQISPSNGYWTDSNGNRVKNIFNPSGLGVGSYSYVFTITSETYCGTSVGDKFPLTIDLRDAALNVYKILANTSCGTSNGIIQLDSIKSGSGDYKYMLTQKISNTEIDTIQDWTNIINLDKDNPIIHGNLGDGEYVLYVADLKSNVSCATLYTETINIANSLPLSITVDTVRLPSHSSPGELVVSKVENGVAPYTYEWYKWDKANNDWINTPKSTNERVAVNVDGKYKVVVTDANGCISNDFIFESSEDPRPMLQYNYYFCQGSFVELFSHITIEPRTVHDLLVLTSENSTWADWIGYTTKVYDDELTNVESDKNWFVNAITNGYLQDGGLITKYITQTDANGVTLAREKITIQIFNRPSDLSLTLLNAKPEWEIEDVVKFETRPEDKQAYVYYLNNKYLDTITTTNLYEVDAIRFTGTVQDMMKVTVIDKVDVPANSKDSVCIWSITQPVVINVPFPNVFTPDGDGINDVFLGGDKFGNREFYLEIFNRYGNLLYSGDKGWDGTFKGTMMTSGVYMYAVHLKMADGTTKLMRGSVTLIRKER